MSSVRRRDTDAAAPGHHHTGRARRRSRPPRHFVSPRAASICGRVAANACELIVGVVLVSVIIGVIEGNCVTFGLW
jgi:hypothetical protein